MSMASNVHINALADSNLAQIFKNLPPFDRLRVSEVCKRWWFVSQDPWRDMTHLELTSIPAESIGAIVRMCPNLTSLFCQNQQLILDDLKNINLAGFKRMELHGCTFVSQDNSSNRTALPLFRSEYGQSMEELILYEHDFGVECELSERYSQRLLPVSLRRLLLSGTSEGVRSISAYASYLTELSKLRNLEGLILHTVPLVAHSVLYNMAAFVGSLTQLQSLRELVFPVVGNLTLLAIEIYCAQLIAMKLPNLELLILPNELAAISMQYLIDLICKHPTLRILVLPGAAEALAPGMAYVPMQVPIRNRVPAGVDAKPLPLLHVFVGKGASELLSFDESPANWLRVRPINAPPFPEYLEREDIKSIFEGSWVAQQIKKGAKRGTRFWNYEDGLVE